MKNAVVEVKKSLCSIAKRCKQITYSTGLAVMFLMLGTSAFSEELMSREALDQAASSMQEKITKLRKENDKSLENLSLGYVQLMEQGDQVVKSPWKSWQVGANYFYSDFRNSNKGYGDKQTGKGILTRKSPEDFSRYLDQGIRTSKYGRTDLVIPQEPEALLISTISIKPKQITRDFPELNISTPNLEMPNFNPRFIVSPKKLILRKLEIPSIVPPSLSGGGANPRESVYSYWMGNDGVISQVSLKKGKYILEGTGDQVDPKTSSFTPVYEAGYWQVKPTNTTIVPHQIKIESYDAELLVGMEKIYSNEGGDKPKDGTYPLEYISYFHTLLNVPYSYYGKDVVIENNRAGMSLIDLETEGRVELEKASPENNNTVTYGTLDEYATRKWITKERAEELKNIKNYSSIKGESEEQFNQPEDLYFVNKGSVYLNAANTNYIFTTSHDEGNYRTNFLDNEGKIFAKGEKSTIVKHTPDTSQAKAWIYTNSKEGEMYADGPSSLVAGWAYQNLPYGKAGFVNNGTVKLRGTNSIGLFFSNDEVVRTGKHLLEYYYPEVVVLSITDDNGMEEVLSRIEDHQSDDKVIYGGVREVSIHDNEELKNLYPGKKSLKCIVVGGFYQKEEINTSIAEGNLLFLKKAIDVLGDSSVGFVSQNNGEGARNEKHLLKFNIGGELPQPFGNAVGKDQKKVEAAIGILEDQDIQPQFDSSSKDYYLNPDGGNYSEAADPNSPNADPDIVNSMKADEKQAWEKRKTKTAAQINIGEHSKEGIGIFARQGQINIINPHPDSGETESFISLNGGEGNMAMIADSEKSIIDFDAKAYVKGGIEQRVALANNGGRIALKKDILVGDETKKPEKVVLFYSKGKSTDNTKKSHIEIKTGANIKAYVAGESTVAYAEQGGEVVFESTAVAPSNIFVDGKDNKATVLYAGENGTIDAPFSNLSLKNVRTGVAAIGANAKANIQNGKLSYSGDGYALYAEQGGTIDFNNGELVLSGRSTAMQLDQNIPNPIQFNNGKIYVESDDVTVFNLLNVNNSLRVSNLKTDIENAVGTGVHVEGRGATQYKIASLDGGEILIDQALSKDAATDTPGGFFFKRFLGQRLKLQVNNNIDASLSNQEADTYYQGQVSGVELNSSSKALSNQETQINVASGVSIKADRKEAGTGAIGIYLNYGTLNLASGSTLEVEKGANVVNEKAVGVFGVNGSEINNEAKIDVSGNKAIGILGTAYRVDTDGHVIEEEFGNAALGQGKINIDNRGELLLDGEAAIGILANNNKSNEASSDFKAKNSSVIKMAGDKSIAMSAVSSQLLNEKTIEMKGTESIGMYGDKASSLTQESNGTIEILKAAKKESPNVGIFANDKESTILNKGKVLLGDYSYGLYGYKIENDSVIQSGNHGVGIFSRGAKSSVAGDGVQLGMNSEIKVGNDSIGLLSRENTNEILYKGKLSMGENSYGVVLMNSDNQNGIRFVGEGEEVLLKKDSTYLYSNDKKADIISKTDLKSSGDGVFGIYSSGKVLNKSNIDFSEGIGNIGLMSISGGEIKYGDSGVLNPYTMKVGKSYIDPENSKNNIYSIGMSAGYLDSEGKLVTTGSIENNANIEITNDHGIGMYAVGEGSKAINRGNIVLDADNATGMYLDQYAVGENYGKIETRAGSTNTNMVGVSIFNGAILKNYGEIIVHGDGNTGIKIVKASQDEAAPGTITASQGAKDIDKNIPAPIEKSLEGISVIAPSKSGLLTAEVKRNGMIVKPVSVDTIEAVPEVEKVKIEEKEFDIIALLKEKQNSLAKASPLGMYVDTSGVNYTKPIQGLQHLKDLAKINLIFGTEATKYTNAKDIRVGENILEPYSKVMEDINNSSKRNKLEWSLQSSSLTWMANGVQHLDRDGLKYVYLSKIPYTNFSKKENKNNYNFLDGLEQRYGVEELGSRENILFQKLNGLGKGETEIFTQAVDEMKGHQYANLQQRIYETGRILGKEFDHVRKEWGNISKDSNKLKAFGMSGEYKTASEGIVDYKNYAQGLAYVHENETVKLGVSSGWYSGFVRNEFRFRDIGKSKEEMYQGRLGYFRTYAFDDNGSLQWTIAGEGFLGRSKMTRRYLVVDDIFHAKSKFWTYGLGIKNELSKEFRLSEGLRVKPYGSLGLEYGRFETLKEKVGEVRLEVKGNGYYSIKPELGVEMAHKTMTARGNVFKTSLSLAYESELGKVASQENKAKVAYTQADYYEFRGEKEDRRGNIKTDLKLGYETARYGVTANLGYDSKGSNIRFGAGLRVIF